MIRVKTVCNPFDENKNTYCYKSYADQSVGIDDLVKYIVKYNSTITAPDALAVLKILDDSVRHLVRMGYKVELPFGYISLRAAGTATDETSSFSLSKEGNKFVPHFQFKKDAVEDMTHDVSFKKDTRKSGHAPQIDSICKILDNGKDDACSAFTVGTLMRIRGKWLSFDVADSNQGVFFETNGKIIRAQQYFRRGSNIIDFVVPDMESGKYSLKVTAKPRRACYDGALYSNAVEVVRL